MIIRVKAETARGIKQLTEQQLNEMKAINTRVIPVVAYVMNVCSLNQKKLGGLDKLISNTISALRDNGMLGRQSSDERLYMKRQNDGRGSKSLKDVYRDTKVRVTCYMANASSPWIKKWENEMNKEGTTLKSEAEKYLRGVGMTDIKMTRDGVERNSMRMEGTWKKQWTELKSRLKEQKEESRRDRFKAKKMQSEYFFKVDKESHQWLKASNSPKKAAIISMQEQMVEKRGWKQRRGLQVKLKVTNADYVEKSEKL